MKSARAPILPSALLLFVFLAYAGTLGYPFFFDDTHFVVNNVAIHTPKNLLKIWTSATYNSSVPDQWGYRPFTTFLHSISWIIGKGSTVPFHVHKKILLTIVCLFLVGIWKRVWSWPGFYPDPAPRLRFGWKGRSRELVITPEVAAWMLAFAFAIHPANNEVANYVSATTTLLAGTCYAGGFYLYLRSREELRRALAFRLGSLALYALAVCAKEEGITLCAVVLLAELLAPRRDPIPLPAPVAAPVEPVALLPAPPGAPDAIVPANPPDAAPAAPAAAPAARPGLLSRPWAQTALRVLPYFAVGAVMALILKTQFAPTSDQARGNIPRWEYFMTQWRAYLHYFKLIVWPFDLNADNLVFGFSSSITDAKVLSALVGNLAILGAAWIRRRANPIFLFCLLWFYIGVSPASSIIPLAEPVNERRMFIGYLGLIGIFPWLVRGVQALCTRAGRVGVASGAIAVLAFAGLVVGSETRSLVWSSQDALWHDTFAKNPYSGRALNNLSLVYMTKQDLKRSTELLESCERFAPTYAVCKINLAIIYGNTGRAAEADVKFREALIFDPHRIDTRTHYADFLMLNRRYETALVLYGEANQLAGGMNLHARVGWIKAAWILGRAEEARAVLEDSRRVFGDVPDLRGLVAEGAPSGPQSAQPPAPGGL